MAELPLADITVVSIEQAVAAPFATRQLADLGARVIKVERPETGDFARAYDETVRGESSYFVWLNRSKESVTLDLKSASGREVMQRLLGQADVLVDNLAPGALQRLGLDAATLQEAHPHIVPCTISGYGGTGPWADRKAYDLIVQAEAGLVSLTGTPDEMAKVGISVADIAAGMYAFSGILTALYQRVTTGRIVPVEVSLFEALTEWMGQPLNYALYSGRAPARVGSQHATIAPYGPFTTADGGVVMLAIQNDREWRFFCERVLGDAALADDARFRTNSARVAHREELNATVDRRLERLSLADAVQQLDEAGIANGRLNGVDELARHPVLAGRERWRHVDTPGGEIQALLPPTTLGGVVPRMGPVPTLGEHTEPVLASLGYSRDAITRLRADRVL